MAPSVEQAADLTTPIVDRRGRVTGSVDLRPPSTAREIIIAVTCAGPGTFEVSDIDGRILSGECTGKGMSSIRISPERITSPLRITAPGEYWIVVAATP